MYRSSTSKDSQAVANWWSDSRPAPKAAPKTQDLFKQRLLELKHQLSEAELKAESSRKQLELELTNTAKLVKRLSELEAEVCTLLLLDH